MQKTEGGGKGGRQAAEGRVWCDSSVVPTAATERPMAAERCRLQWRDRVRFRNRKRHTPSTSTISQLNLKMHFFPLWHTVHWIWVLDNQKKNYTKKQRLHAIFILSQVSQPGSQNTRKHPEGASPSSPLSLLHNRTTLSTLTDRSVSVKLCSDNQNLFWGGLFTNPPTHSKSKCTIKNAHLTSSSRLPNAYASYLRDQEKWYCKQYRISFIMHIQFRFLQEAAGVFFFLLCCQADWTWGNFETHTRLVERHPSGCRLGINLHTVTDSLSLSISH